VSRRQRRQQERRAERRLGAKKLGAAGTLALGATLVAPAAAQATDFEVNDLGDPGTGGCNGTECTLREAVEAADANGGPDRVLFQSGLSGTITVDSGAGSITIDDGVQVLGPGAAQITVDGNDAFGLLVFQTPTGGEDVLISGLTITGGQGFFNNGGAINNPSANLTVADSSLIDNYSDNGGAIFSSGQLTITNSILTGNEGFYTGGAIRSSGPVTISNSNISDNFTEDGSADGGAIHSSGALTITNSTLNGNDTDLGGSDPGDGGAIISFGSATISDSTLSGNTADTTGGAILVQTGSLQLESSTLSGNTTDNAGAGIYFYNSDDGTQSAIRNSTIAGNTVTNVGGGFDDGGAIYIDNNNAQGPLLIQNSTLYGNSVPTGIGDRGGAIYDRAPNGPVTTITASTIAGNSAGEAGGIFQFNGQTLQNTIVADNTAANQGPDLYDTGDPFNVSFSLIENPEDATINEAVIGSTIFGVDPQLGALASNGGPTQTQALTASSPALDKGSAFGLTTDQRGSARPIDFAATSNSGAPGGNAADIGAFELQGTTTCNGKAATHVGSDANNNIVGTPNADVIVGLGGGDVIDGGGGDDLICAGTGNDNVKGGAGKDDLRAEGGRDKASGESGNDKVTGGGGKDRLKGGSGKDRISGNGGKDVVAGNGGKDNLKGNGGPDTLKGGAAKDTLKGGGRRDRLFGGGGNDRLLGGGGNDSCAGGPGKDKQKSC